MRLFLLALTLVAAPAWAQPSRPEGEPSPTVSQQQKQADYARKGHPDAGKPKKQEPASLKTKDTQRKPPRSEPGGAALRAPSK
jgi:hypothetical protein